MKYKKKRREKMGKIDKEDTKYFSERSKYKKMCKCGHRISFPPTRDKLVCHWCGRYVFANKKNEFLFRLNEARGKERRNG